MSNDKGMLSASNISFGMHNSWRKSHGPNRPVYAFFIFSIMSNHKETTTLINRVVNKHLSKFYYYTLIGISSKSTIRNLISSSDILLTPELEGEEYIVLAFWSKKKKPMYRLDTLFKSGVIPGYLGYIYNKTDCSSSQFESLTKERVFLSKNNISHSAQVLLRAITGEYVYALTGLVIGLASILLGVLLFINGVAGSSSWVAKMVGLSSEINDAPPGVILFIVGLFVIIASKPKVKLKNLKG